MTIEIESGEADAVAAPVSPEPGGMLLYRAAGEMTVSAIPTGRSRSSLTRTTRRRSCRGPTVGSCRRSVNRGRTPASNARAARIHVNRDHNRERACGRTLTLYPDRDEGLVAHLRMSPTPLGDETLALAADGVLHASVGFKPLPGGEKWSRDRRQVRLTKCWLSHIALVPEPAYEGAAVLAVRSPATQAGRDRRPGRSPG